LIFFAVWLDYEKRILRIYKTFGVEFNVYERKLEHLRPVGPAEQDAGCDFESHMFSEKKTNRKRKE
jgi:hypothetical protein